MSSVAYSRKSARERERFLRLGYTVDQLVEMGPRGIDASMMADLREALARAGIVPAMPLNLNNVDIQHVQPTGEPVEGERGEPIPGRMVAILLDAARGLWGNDLARLVSPETIERLAWRLHELADSEEGAASLRDDLHTLAILIRAVTSEIPSTYRIVEREDGRRKTVA